MGRTQFAKNCEEYGIYKTNSGYYRKEDIDKMLSGEIVAAVASTPPVKLRAAEKTGLFTGE